MLIKTHFLKIQQDIGTFFTLNSQREYLRSLHHEYLSKNYDIEESYGLLENNMSARTKCFIFSDLQKALFFEKLQKHFMCKASEENSYKSIFKMYNEGNYDRYTSVKIQEMRLIDTQLNYDWKNCNEKCIEKMTVILSAWGFSHAGKNIFNLNVHLNKILLEDFRHPNISDIYLKVFHEHLQDFYKLIYFMGNPIYRLGNKKKRPNCSIYSICDLIRIHLFHIEPLRRINKAIHFGKNHHCYFYEYEKVFDIIKLFTFYEIPQTADFNIFQESITFDSQINDNYKNIFYNMLIDKTKPPKIMVNDILDLINIKVSHIHEKCQILKGTQKSKYMNHRRTVHYCFQNVKLYLKYIFEYIETGYNDNEPINFITSDEYRKYIIQLSEHCMLLFKSNIIAFVGARLFLKDNKFIEGRKSVYIQNIIKIICQRKNLGCSHLFALIEIELKKLQLEIYLWDYGLDYLISMQKTLIINIES